MWTGWVSETSLACKVGSGGTGSVGMAATVGENVASMSGGLSYETGTMSGGPSRNVGVAGGDVVSLSGRGFGTSRYVFRACYSCRGRSSLRGVLESWLLGRECM